MSELLLFFLLVLNFGISAWNAFVAGATWQESKQIGGFIRAVTWCAVIMAACGFTMVAAAVIGMVSFATGIIDHRAFQALMSLTYLLIIVPILGSGLVITIHSWIIAWRERDWASIGVAGWNTFAQAKNMYDAANGGISSAFSNVADFFKPSSDDDGKGAAAKIALLLIMMVAMVVAGGLTYVFFQMGLRRGLAAPKVAEKSALFQRDRAYR